MSQERSMAIVTADLGEEWKPARLTWCAPQQQATSRLPGTDFWYIDLVNGGKVSKNTQEPQEQHRLLKLARRQAKRLDENARMLFEGSKFGIGSRAICECRHVEGAKVFSSVRLAGGQHFVAAQGLRQVSANFAQLGHVTVVTGICLFSNRAVTLESVDGQQFSVIDARWRRAGQRLRTITEDSRLTLYEWESCARLTGFISDLIAALLPGPRITVRLVIPRVQYYGYLLDLFAKNLVDRDLLLLWFRMVDRRRDRVIALYCDRLRQSLDSAGVADRVTFTISSTLDPLVPLIESAVQADRMPTLGNLLPEMAHSDPLWREASHITPPGDLLELGYLSYVVEYLRNDISAEQAPYQLTVAVEDPVERKIYNQAKTLAKALWPSFSQPQRSLLGLYPLSPILAAGDLPWLYHNDPGHLFVDDTGDHYDPAKLVEFLHGRNGCHTRDSGPL